MTLVLHEDPVARGWEPFWRTRPIGEMLFGAFTLRERIELALGSPAYGYLAPHLDGYDEADARRSRPDLGDATPPTVVLSSRYVPPLPGESGHRKLTEAISAVAGAGRIVVDGEPAGWVVSSSSEVAAVVEAVRSGTEESAPEMGDVTALPGELIPSPWDLMARNADRLSADLEGGFPAGATELGERADVSRVGDGRISVSGDVTVDPGCVLDTRGGPIHLGADVHLRPFTYLAGPAMIGAGTTLFGGTFEALSVGPRCKLRGEISETIFLGFANKAHDGYIGHSVVGRWVNLGAFTTNSDLKNNYGSIRVGAPDGTRDTEMIKVGVFLGDHTKTGIGIRLNGGTVVGAGSNLYGDGFPPKWVPPFHWGAGAELVPHRLAPFLETAERAMSRRGVSLSSDHRAFLSAAWARVHGSGA